MIKKRTRPQARMRAPDPDVEDSAPAEGDEPTDEPNLPLADLIELRGLRRARQGIDATRLVVGDAKRKRRRADDADGGEEEQGGLHKGAARDGAGDDDDDDADKEDDKDAQARRVVRNNNFTQQTNVMDVDKHMMAYIEENMQKRKGTPNVPAGKEHDPADPYAELYKLADKYKPQKAEKEEEGSVAGSLAMLTAIPEVDLGMDARLKNIEETEKAKRLVADARKERKTQGNGDVPSTRFFQQNQRPKSDADLIEDARREAMGLPPQEDIRRHNDRNQMATDEYVMEKFKKRMRK